MGYGLHDLRVMGRTSSNIVFNTHLQVYKVPTLGEIGTQISNYSADFSRGGYLSDLGGTLHFLTYNLGNGFYSFAVGNSILGSVGDVLQLAGVVGTYPSPLVSDGVKVYANLPNGIWNFNAAPSKLVNSEHSLDYNPMQVMYRNYLYFKNKNSIIKYDGTDTTSIGYDLDDGLPSDKMGEATSMVANWKFLYAAVKGATYSHILTYDGTGWQYFARWPTAGVWIKRMVLSNLPDAILRLWCFPGNGDQWPGYFLNPLVNPLQAGTYSYVPSGYYMPPVFGGGMPEEPGGWYRTVVSGEGITGTNDVRIRYGLDGVVPGTLLGLAGSLHSSLLFGSPVGIEAYRLQPEIGLFRNPADTGTTPVVRETLVNYLKDPTKRYNFDVEIDLEETAKKWVNPVEAVIGSLNFVTNLKTLAPFWYGQIATTYVKVLDAPFSEETDNVRYYETERTGFVRIRLAQISPI